MTKRKSCLEHMGGILQLYPRGETAPLEHRERVLRVLKKLFREKQTEQLKQLVRTYLRGYPCHITIFYFDPVVAFYFEEYRNGESLMTKEVTMQAEASSADILYYQYAQYQYDFLLHPESVPDLIYFSRHDMFSFWRNSRNPWMKDTKWKGLSRSFPKKLCLLIEITLHMVLSDFDKHYDMGGWSAAKKAPPPFDSRDSFGRGIHLFFGITCNRFVFETQNTMPATKDEIYAYLQERYVYWQERNRPFTQSYCQVGDTSSSPKTIDDIRELLNYHRYDLDKYLNYGLSALDVREQPVIIDSTRFNRALDKDEINFLHEHLRDDWKVILFDTTSRKLEDNFGHFHVWYYQSKQGQVHGIDFNMPGSDLACASYALVFILRLMRELRPEKFAKYPYESENESIQTFLNQDQRYTESKETELDINSSNIKIKPEELRSWLASIAKRNTGLPQEVKNSGFQLENTHIRNFLHVFGIEEKFFYTGALTKTFPDVQQKVHLLTATAEKTPGYLERQKCAHFYENQVMLRLYQYQELELLASRCGMSLPWVLNTFHYPGLDIRTQRRDCYMIGMGTMYSLLIKKNHVRIDSEKLIMDSDTYYCFPFVLDDDFHKTIYDRFSSIVQQIYIPKYNMPNPHG